MAIFTEIISGSSKSRVFGVTLLSMGMASWIRDRADSALQQKEGYRGHI